MNEDPNREKEIEKVSNIEIVIYIVVMTVFVLVSRTIIYYAKQGF